MTFSLILDRARRRGRGGHDERIPSPELLTLKKSFQAASSISTKMRIAPIKEEIDDLYSH